LPIAMGPQYERDLHFVDLLDEGAGISVRTGEELDVWYEKLHSDPEYLSSISRTATNYCLANKGATDVIMDLIFKD